MTAPARRKSRSFISRRYLLLVLLLAAPLVYVSVREPRKVQAATFTVNGNGQGLHQLNRVAPKVRLDVGNQKDLSGRGDSVDRDSDRC